MERWTTDESAQRADITVKKGLIIMEDGQKVSRIKRSHRDEDE